jgi:hypothetical protein
MATMLPSRAGVQLAWCRMASDGDGRTREPGKAGQSKESRGRGRDAARLPPAGSSTSQLLSTCFPPGRYLFCKRVERPRPGDVDHLAWQRLLVNEQATPITRSQQLDRGGQGESTVQSRDARGSCPQGRRRRGHAIGRKSPLTHGRGIASGGGLV